MNDDIIAFFSQSLWYWFTIILASVAGFFIFVIPENLAPLIFLRSMLGLVLILFLPGFALMKALFPNKSRIKPPLVNMANVEQVTLSVGLSLVISPLVGLILNFTPWGIRLVSVTLSLWALTIVLATVAMVRANKHQSKSEVNQVRDANTELILDDSVV